MRKQAPSVARLIEQAVAGDADAWAWLRTADILSPGVRTPALVAAVVDAGHRLGWSPERSLRRMTVADDKVCVSAGAAVSLVLQHFPDAKLLPVTVTAKGARVRAQRAPGDPWSEFSYSALEARNAGLTGQRRWRHAAGEICWERAVGRCCVSLFADLFADLHFDWEVRARQQHRSTTQTGDTLPIALIRSANQGSAA